MGITMTYLLNSGFLVRAGRTLLVFDNYREKLEESDFADNKISILDLLIKCNFSSSRGEAKRLIQQGGISVNNNPVSDTQTIYSKSDFADGLKVKKGKKHFCKVTF